MTFEFCINSVEGALVAQRFGAKRVELCSALNVGGLTPSYGLIKQCAQYDVEVHVMIRHIEGGFYYNKNDLHIMEQDIKIAKQAGATGVVLGCLTNQNTLAIDANIRLIETARNLDLTVTFHRAFDLIQEPEEALISLINLGVHRILTSGQKPKAIEGIDTIKNLVQWANREIEIMAGSGVNSSNAIALSETGIDALHFTIHKFNSKNESLGMGNRSIIDEEKITSILSLFK